MGGGEQEQEMVPWQVDSLSETHRCDSDEQDGPLVKVHFSSRWKGNMDLGSRQPRKGGRGQEVARVQILLLLFPPQSPAAVDRIPKSLASPHSRPHSLYAIFPKKKCGYR